MKKILIILILACSCNMSDQEINLPEDYLFFKEGSYANTVLRNHNAIIEHSAIDFSYNKDYVMFIFDTLNEKPKIIDINKLFFLVHDIKKDSLSQRMNFREYKSFIKLKRIKKEEDLTLRKYR